MHWRYLSQRESFAISPLVLSKSRGLVKKWQNLGFMILELLSAYPNHKRSAPSNSTLFLRVKKMTKKKKTKKMNRPSTIVKKVEKVIKISRKKETKSQSSKNNCTLSADNRL